MRELHLFAGAGGGILGGILCGHTTVCAVEIEPYCRKVLLQRQRDGILPKFPIWDDVRTFDGKPWRGLVDLVCAGFPCQDISMAGDGAGIDGERSGLYSESIRVIGEIRPRFAVLENSPALTHRGLGRVLGDLAALGYNARWGVLGAEHAGAIHRRHRIWILAYPNKNGYEGEFIGMQEIQRGKAILPEVFPSQDGRWPQKDKLPQPMCIRGSDGVADWRNRLAAIGNGQVPAVVKLAWDVLRG